MKAIFLCTLLAVTPLAWSIDVSAAPADSAVYRSWTDVQGRKLEATFRGIEDGQVYLQIKSGFVHRLPMDRLSAEDQKIAQTLKPEGLGIPVDPALAQAATKIDFLVEAGLKHRDQKPNPLASDEQFVRRIYLDTVGRIPTREEALALINDTTVSKRAKLIDKLIADPGANSHMFNYLTDMLRIADEANKGKFYSYEEWLKGKLKENTPWDQVVREMLSADGKLLQNGATGYLLRDAGMRLDNLSLTLSTFLGANVSCAQCHDHPFAEWTQHQFYQMAAFFGASDTVGYRSKKGSVDQKQAQMALRSLDDVRLQQQGRTILRISGMKVNDGEDNDMALPDDYKYKDAKPGDLVAPQLISWSNKDRQLRAYRDIQTKEPSQWRAEFAKWMTAPDNPRFAMTIANRMWKRAFGVAVKEPISDLDDPEAAFNPPLLHHLTAEMVRLRFDLKAFMRLIFNTQAYQREATNYEFEAGAPYMFAGPTLRRMTAEQAWDSCSTLVVGAQVDQFQNLRADKYAEAMSIDLSASDIEGQIKKAIAGMREANTIAGIPSGGKNKGKAKKTAAMQKRMARQMAEQPEEEEDGINTRPPMLGGMVLARASELRQPERDQHFLRQFGQSDRQIADSTSDEGNVPQVLMLMNGDAQTIISSPESLVVKTANAQTDNKTKIESLYASFFCRRPSSTELATASEALGSGMGINDLAWVLFNTREFMFIE
jgi:Protein of unknown function (DUF1549)/Protein of unknown function (DUF1553)